MIRQLTVDQYEKANNKTDIRAIRIGSINEIWSSIQRFRDYKYVAQRIITRDHIPEKFHSDVKKQAQQIAFTLLQAEEYWTAASSAGPATSPLLYYYGMMCLAIAELLWKQNGEVSLDHAREEHGHHGLEICLKEAPSLLERICAKPHIRGNGFILNVRSDITGACRGESDQMHLSKRPTEHGHG